MVGLTLFFIAVIAAVIGIGGLYLLGKYASKHSEE